MIVALQFAVMDKAIKKKRFPIKRIIGIIVLLAFAGFFVYQILYVDKKPTVYAKTAEITVAEVIKKEFQEYVNVTGVIIPGDTLYLDAREGGQVKEIFVETGDTVKEGQTILTLENTDLEMDELLKKARIIEKEYELQSARINCEKKRHALKEELLDLDFRLKKLEKDYRRNKKLYQSKYISPDEFEEIEDAYLYWKEKRQELLASTQIEERLMGKSIKQIDAGLDLLKTDFQKTQKRLEDLTLVSPATGLLTSLDASIGETKNKGSRIGQIDLTKIVKMEAEIDEYYLDRVSVGNMGSFTIMDLETTVETEFKIRMATISPEVRNNVFDAEFAFVGARPLNVRLGQSFTVRLALGAPYEAVVLEKGPYIQNSGGSWVFVIDASGKKAWKRRIKTGKNNPEFVEVLEGLTPGQKVIVSSYDDFGDMDQVELN